MSLMLIKNLRSRVFNIHVRGRLKHLFERHTPATTCYQKARRFCIKTKTFQNICSCLVPDWLLFVCVFVCVMSRHTSGNAKSPQTWHVAQDGNMGICGYMG